MNKKEKDLIVLPYIWKENECFLVLNKKPNPKITDKNYDILISPMLIDLEGNRIKEATKNDIYFAVMNLLWFVVQKNTELINTLENIKENMVELSEDV